MTSGSDSDLFVPGKLYHPRVGVINMTKYTEDYDPDIETYDSEKIRWDQKSPLMYVGPLDNGGAIST